VANIFDTLITVVVGTITGVVNAVTGTVAALQDFFYIKISGVSFIVLGARQTGKTTLIEWLKHNLHTVADFAPDPTAAGGDAVPDFTARVGDTYMKLKPTRDVGGEYAMWETDWIDLFRGAEPRGILFLIDHTDPYIQKDALNFVLQMIDDEPAASKHLKAFYILVNKSDLWGDETTLDDILGHYKNEQKRLKSQADRLHYKWEVVEGSLVTERGVTELMRKFFNTIRPKPVA
jgi:signal recognition particle receptor subunit beta